MTWENWAKIAPCNLARYANGRATAELHGAEGFTDAASNSVTRLELLKSDPEAIVRGLYEQLARRDIDYDLEPLEFRPDVQAIRRPAEVLGFEQRYGPPLIGRGTCLDLSLVFAAMCLEARLLPLVVLLDHPGHALVVVNLVQRADEWDHPGRPERGLAGGIFGDLDGLKRCIDSGSHVAVECTGFSRHIPGTDGRDASGRLPYDAAVAHARARLEQQPLVAAIDLATLQAAGLEPFPLATGPLGRAAAATAEDMDQVLREIAALKDQMAANPDRGAMQDLSTALDQVFETWTVVDQAITRFLAGALSTESLTGHPERLLELTGGSLPRQIADGRGHCHRMTQLYDSTIRAWFATFLDRDALDNIDGVFDRLRGADDDAFRVMEDVGDLLADEAQAVVDLLAAHDIPGAQRRVADAMKDIQPLRDAIGRSMLTMTDLKFEILAAAG